MCTLCRRCHHHTIYCIKYSNRSYILNIGPSFCVLGYDIGRISTLYNIHIYIYIYIYIHTYINSYICIYIHIHVYYRVLAIGNSKHCKVHMLSRDEVNSGMVYLLLFTSFSYLFTCLVTCLHV